jgi:hypothetical protein
VVPLPRRLAAVLIALIATVSFAGTALGSPRDVINDFLEEGVIDRCHSEADYDGARREKVDTGQYSDLPGAIDAARANPALVGTDAKPCPTAPDEGGSGIGGIALVAVPIGLCIVALAMVFGGRRRRKSDVDEAEPPA